MNDIERNLLLNVAEALIDLDVKLAPQLIHLTGHLYESQGEGYAEESFKKEARDIMSDTKGRDLTDSEIVLIDNTIDLLFNYFKN